jgi:Na+-driven multidrug efflux pump
VSEFKTISRHAGTVLIGQLATMAFGMTDTIVAGRYAESSLALPPALLFRLYSTLQESLGKRLMVT